MYSANKFEFTAEAPEGADVTIDGSIQGKEALLRELAQGLSFPEYFGKNWDALIDCVSDLSWLTKPEVIIDHASIPKLAENDLRLYLESLIDAADRRTPDILPKLRILFRIEHRQAIDSVLEMSS